MSFRAVLLSYNHVELTRQSLNSILDHFKCSEVSLVHNGSESEHVLALKQSYPGITHLVLKQNKGFSGGCNFGLTESFKHCDWVYFFTNDTFCTSIPVNLPTTAGLYAPFIYKASNKTIDSIGGYFRPLEKKLFHAKTAEEFYHAKQDFKNSPHEIIPYIPGTAFLIHKSISEQIGLMDESLHTYWEDVDFSARAMFSGLKVDICSEFTLLHKGRRTCGKKPFYTNFLFKRNQELISKKYSQI